MNAPAGCDDDLHGKPIQRRADYRSAPNMKDPEAKWGKPDMERTIARPIGAEDERAIVTILLRYATGIDTRDWALFRSCFSDDFEADYGEFGRWRGPREITEYMRQAHADLGKTLHRMTNFTIEHDGGCVRARSYVDALLMPAATGGQIHRGIGWYNDLMLRTSNGWKISRRTFNPVQIA
jgi:hypothetical protein